MTTNISHSWRTRLALFFATVVSVSLCLSLAYPVVAQQTGSPILRQSLREQSRSDLKQSLAADYRADARRSSRMPRVYAGSLQAKQRSTMGAASASAGLPHESKSVCCGPAGAAAPKSGFHNSVVDESSGVSGFSTTIRHSSSGNRTTHKSVPSAEHSRFGRSWPRNALGLPRAGTRDK